MKEYYVCLKYGTIWSGRVDQMIEDYGYPESSTWYFNTKEEANEFINKGLY